MKGVARAVGVTLAFVALALATAWLFARVLAPSQRAAAVPAASGFDASVLRKAMEPTAVAAVQAEILAAGSRYLGQPGVEAAAEQVRRAFEASGLELHEQHIRTVAPRTRVREIRLLDPTASGGRSMPGVEVFPLMPNHLQPVVTPPGGLSGRLLVLDTKTLARERDLRDVIGVLDTSPGGVDPAYGYHWMRYARLGVKALIVAHRDGIGSIDWNLVAQKKFSGMVSSVPVNFVRVAATQSIFEHVGQRVQLEVRVDFEEHPSRTFLGVLRAKHPVDEAVVVASPYDAAAVLPDSAPGAIPALNLAWMLGVARGLGATRETLQRDVVFVSSAGSVMSEDGLNQILRVLQFNTSGNRSNRLIDAFRPTEVEADTAEREGVEAVLGRRLEPIREREIENQKKAAFVREILAALKHPKALREPAATAAALQALGPGREFFREQFQYVLNTVVFERQEVALEKKLAFERSSGGTKSPAFAAFRAARRKLDAANAVAGSGPVTVLERYSGYAREVGLRERALERFEELHAWHARRSRELASDRDVAKIFSRYRVFDVLVPSFAPGGTPDSPEVLSLFTRRVRGTQSLELLLDAGARQLGLAEPAFRLEPMVDRQQELVEKNCAPWPSYYYFMLESTGYQGVGLVNFGRQSSYQNWTSPVVQPFMLDLSTLRGSFASSGELVLQLAHGSGLLNATPGYPWQRRNYGGKVLASNVGQSIVPSYPLKRAVLGARSLDGEEQHSELGYWRTPFYMADPYGRYDLPEQAADFPVWWRTYSRGYAYTPLAVGYGKDGLISYMKDEGDEGQRLFRSVDVPMQNVTAIENTTIVAFRAAPMTLLDLTNPQDFKDYLEVEMITRDGLVPFGEQCRFTGVGFMTTWLPPDEYANVLLKSGVANNDTVRETRAFMLGVGARAPPNGKPGGYLVADHPFFHEVPLEAGRSMAWINGQRLTLQNRYGMADERANRYQERTVALLKAATEPSLSAHEASQKARDAVSYAGLNHPVLRRSLFEAVIGILFYLGLLVPFVFFAEKLLFCCADARRQLAAQAAIFVLVFALLRVLHPAFQMVRSSLMILLGFVIILVSSGITLLFASKARENLEELEKRQGKLRAAEVNTLGVLSSSFLVGLNNMHRRKVRTGLTCATLTLLTFVMICFTSTQNDVVDETKTLGGADYQGLLVKHDDFVPLSTSEVFALKSKFSDRFSVTERRFFTGMQDWNERKRSNPALSAAFEAAGGRRQASFSSILQLSPEEPLRHRMRLLTERGWFRPEHATDDGKLSPVLLPDQLAERLGVRIEDVNRRELTLAINGKEFLIWGIFESASLNALRDLDGSDLLPFDIERVASASETTVGTLTFTTAKRDDPRILAERIIVSPVRDLNLTIYNTKGVVTNSVAVDMSRASHREARETIESHLEKTALPAFYGLDGVAYRGLRARALTLAGLLDLLVPLLLAGLTVLNTMKGSVYERRGEIYVYNAVGIAPRYVLVMFLAEAFVYVVVGSMLGYLLSQGTGRILTLFGLTGGLRMTFTSLTTIYATLAIAAAVLISTWFPARDAMEIAAPAEESGWKLPDPIGDQIAFDLPFTFRSTSRIAVLAFFERWFSAHGEGSAGPFFASLLDAHVAAAPDPATGGALPELELTVWLKPFDLAVSQRLVLSVPFDPETSEYKARLLLERLSGTREAWLRLNERFVAGLRRHFLHWRAVTPAEEAEMLVEARAHLESRHPELAGAPVGASA